jgi:LmbE family N-acetylglucosaminyl deacetylase
MWSDRLRLVKRRVEQVASDAVAGVWAAGFGALARVRPAAVPSWTSSGGLTVLCLAPHPDDETMGCGGTLVAHRRAGDRVQVVVVTDGSASTAGGLDAATMRQRRRNEAGQAARILGAELDWLGLVEDAWDVEALGRTLVDLLPRLRPAIVYAPSLVDYHPEHRRVAEALALALGRFTDEPGTHLPLVRAYQVQVPLASLTNLVCNVSRERATLEAALASYRTQAGSVRGALRPRLYAARRYRRGTLAEAFWELSADVYRQLHLTPGYRAAHFRGLRRLSLTDPLAYLLGRPARRSLALAGTGRPDAGI